MSASKVVSDRAARQLERGTVTEVCPECRGRVRTNLGSVVRHRDVRTDEWCAGLGRLPLSGLGVEPVPGDDEVSAKRRGHWARTAVLPRALAFVQTVREEHRLGIGAFLAGLDRPSLEALAVVLAALVPDDRSVEELLAWTEAWDDRGRPVGAGGGRERDAV